MITKGGLRPVLKQFLPTSTVTNALGQIRRICMLILGNKGLTITRCKSALAPFSPLFVAQGQVVQKAISPNPGLKFNRLFILVCST